MLKPKTHVDPLIEQGHKVSLLYTNLRAFETREVTYRYGRYRDKESSYQRSRLPSLELRAWLEKNAGPRGVLWTVEKSPNYEGMDFYFYKPAHAILFKLTWANL